LHEECKQLSAANKQGCLFSLAQAIRPEDISASSNISRQPQNPSRTLSQTSQLLRNTTTQNLAHSQIAHPPPSYDDSDDEEQFVLNKKKIKFEGKYLIIYFADFSIGNSGFRTEDKQQTFPKIQLPNNHIQTPLSDIAYTRQHATSQPRSVHQESNVMNPINFPVYQQSQPIYVPYMQIPQDNNHLINQNGLLLTYPQSFNGQNLPVFQNYGLNAQNHRNNMDDVPQSATPSTKENNSNFKEMLEDMQSKLVDLLSTQNKMLIDLREKNELVQDTLACLINEVNTLKKVVKTNNPGVEKVQITEQNFAGPQIVDNFREIPNNESLLRSLYGPKQDFKYQLVLKNELPAPLYRERNFKFTVFLTDQEGNLVKNTNRIPLTIAIYTSENPPKYVDVNTSGNKILKGMIDKDLVDGAVTFDKIQVKEVTSHFRNGWVFFVVQPKSSGNVLNNLIDMTNGVMINPQNVKPLIIEKMVVKAKRSKEKKQGLDLEEEKDTEIEQEQEQDQETIFTQINQTIGEEEVYV